MSSDWGWLTQLVVGGWDESYSVKKRPRSTASAPATSAAYKDQDKGAKK